MITLMILLLLIIFSGKLMRWLFPRVKGNNLMLTGGDHEAEENLTGELLVFGGKVTAGKSSKGYSYLDALVTAGLTADPVITETEDFSDYLAFFDSEMMVKDYDGIIVELPVGGKKEALWELLQLLRQRTTAPIIVFSILGVETQNPQYEELIKGTWDLKKGIDFTFIDFWHNRHLEVEAKNNLRYMIGPTDPTIAGQQAIYLPRLKIVVKDWLESEEQLDWEELAQPM